MHWSDIVAHLHTYLYWLINLLQLHNVLVHTDYADWSGVSETWWCGEEEGCLVNDMDGGGFL